jgi:addiction module HigA family antidote
VLVRRFLIPRKIPQGVFADAIGMHEANLSTFISGRRGLTPWMAWAFARVLRTKPQYWMQLQGEYDLWLARPRRARRKRSTKTRRR